METKGNLKMIGKTEGKVVEGVFTEKNGQEKIEENPAIKQLTELMKQQGMSQQSQEFTQILQYVVGMQIQLSAISAEVHMIREQLSAVQKGQPREAEAGGRVTTINKMEDLQKKNSRLLQNLSAIKNHFIDTAEKAIKAFKEKGKEGMSKVLQRGISGAKSMLEGYRENLVNTKTNYEKTADRVERIGNEFKQMGTSAGNVGRLMVGKETKEVSHEKPGIVLTRAIDTSIKKNIDTMQKQIDGVDKALEKLDRLSVRLGAEKEAKKEERESVAVKLQEMKDKVEQQNQENENREPEHSREEAR